MPTPEPARSSHIDCYGTAVADDASGSELARIVASIERAGHEIGGETYARAARGFPAPEPRLRLLRHGTLYAHAELPATLAVDADLVPSLMRHWRAFAPLHRWLVGHAA